MEDQFRTGLVQVPEDTKQTAEKVGYLTKRGAKWKNWKRRYFVLKDNFLYYFVDPKDVIPKGVILLKSVTIENAEKITKKKLCISVQTGKSFTAKTGWQNRMYFFQAEKEEDLESWKKAISNAAPGKKLPHTQQMTDEIAKLFKGCAKGETALVKSLLDSKKVGLDCMDEEGNTPLHWATVGGHVELTQLLVDHGADVEAKSKDGFTPLHSVAQEDHYKIMEVLLNAKAKVDVPNIEDNCNTTLHYTACWGAVECTKLLIARGATIDAKAADLSTPLSFAAEKGHLVIAKMLIEAGANVESKNDPEEKGGATPFLLAAHNGQTEAVKLLLEKKAKVDEKTIDGLGCLHLAIRSGTDNEELMKILAKTGTNINAKTNNGDTPLHYAAYMGYVKCASVLIQAGAHLEDRGQNDSTPMHFAAREGQMDVLTLLVQKGASLDTRDKDGDTPLGCAEINQHTKCMEFLKSKS